MKNLPKPTIKKNEFANLLINCEQVYSEKYLPYYYKNKYCDLTSPVIIKAKEIIENKQMLTQEEILDI